MRILLDECVRRDALKLFSNLDASHVRDVGLDSIQNGELIRRADQDFDVLLTVDKNMPYQQSLKGRNLAVVVLDVPDVELATYERFMPVLRQRLSELQPGTFTVIGDPLGIND